MISGNSSHLEMLTTLLDHNVEFLIVGGYAVILHGYIRTTGDLDIWVNPTPENITRMLKAFTQMGFDPEGIETIRQMNFSNVVVFHIGEEPDRIDFLSQIAGVDFTSAISRHEFVIFNQYRIPYLHLEDLIANKTRSGRMQDLADVEELRNIAHIRNQQKKI